MIDQLLRGAAFSLRVSRRVSAKMNAVRNQRGRRRTAQRRGIPGTLLSRLPIECGEVLENRLLLSAANFSADDCVAAVLEPVHLANTPTVDESRSVVTSDSTPTILWNDADPNTTYEVLVNEVGATPPREFSALGLTTAEFTPTESLSDGLYRFVIRAEFADGSHSAWTSPFEVAVQADSNSFANSLTWLPQTDFEHYLTTDQLRFEHIIVSDDSYDDGLILPSNLSASAQTEAVTVTTTYPDVTQTADKDKQAPGLDMAEADPDKVADRDDMKLENPQPKPEEQTAPNTDAEKLDTPNAKQPPVERIAEDPSTNRTVLFESIAPRRSRDMTIVSALDVDSSVLDKAFADLAARSMLAAV